MKKLMVLFMLVSFVLVPVSDSFAKWRPNDDLPGLIPKPGDVKTYFEAAYDVNHKYMHCVVYTHTTDNNGTKVSVSILDINEDACLDKMARN